MIPSKSKGKQGISCQYKGCDFITKITNKSKAKKKVRQHEQTHKNIEMPDMKVENEKNEYIEDEYDEDECRPIENIEIECGICRTL